LFTPRDMELAGDHFRRALDLDGDNALAHWGLGRTCRFQLQFGLGRPREREPECREHLLAALRIDPDLPQVHLGLALGYWLYDYDWEAAENAFDRAIELNPNYAEAHMFYSHLLAILHRIQESNEHIERAVSLDPVNIFVLGLHGAQKQLTGRPEAAVEILDRLHQQVPGFGFGYDVLWMSNFSIGNLEAALDAAEKTFSVTMGIPVAAEAIERGYAADGFTGAMLELGEALEALEKTRYVSAVFIALPFAMAGNAEKATEWLERGFDRHDPMMPYMGVVPCLDLIEDDPRYLAILERMNLDRPPL
jgi:Tfp pilus assembly protein PilF